MDIALQFRGKTTSMEKHNLEQFNFTDKFKEKFVLMVVYQNHSPKSLVKKYGLPQSLHIGKLGKDL